MVTHYKISLFIYIYIYTHPERKYIYIYIYIYKYPFHLYRPACLKVHTYVCGNIRYHKILQSVYLSIYINYIYVCCVYIHTFS